MARYRLVPTLTGIALKVPLDFEHLLARVQPGLPLLRMYGDWPFVVEASRWGYDGVLKVTCDLKSFEFALDFASPKRRQGSCSLQVLQVVLASDDDPDPYAPLVGLERLCSDSDLNGSDLKVELAPEMMDQVFQFSDEQRQRVSGAMKRASRLLTLSHTVGHPFDCRTERGLELVIPGQGTWLASGLPRRDGSAAMHGHNIDTCVQQFTLLAGLAEAQAIVEELCAKR